MKLIIGLGNPGVNFQNSRHNIGFRVVKAFKRTLKKERGIPALSAKLKLRSSDAVLAVPVTFMNLSGSAVLQLIKRYKIAFQDLLVVCDDLDLEFGRLKIRPNGSSGGHRGLKSVIEAIKSEDFSRLRIGIGRPHSSLDSSEYVLSDFSGQEKKELKEIISKALDCCRVWLAEGAPKAMNIFNAKEKA